MHKEKTLPMYDKKSKSAMLKAPTAIYEDIQNQDLVYEV